MLIVGLLESVAVALTLADQHGLLKAQLSQMQREALARDQREHERKS